MITFPTIPQMISLMCSSGPSRQAIKAQEVFTACQMLTDAKIYQSADSKP
jgi:hypothetical protein